MQPMQMLVYLQEVSTAADMGVALRNNFLRLVADDKERQNITVWLMLQAALLHYGMVSKFIFPVAQAGKTGRDRASALRAELGIEDSSPLNNRDARNALEHFDERIDQCIERPEAGILQMVFNDRAGYEFLAADRWVVRRAYIVDEDVFVTEGPKGKGRVEMPLSEIFGELEKIAAFAEHRLDGKFKLH